MRLFFTHHITELSTQQETYSFLFSLWPNAHVTFKVVACAKVSIVFCIFLHVVQYLCHRHRDLELEIFYKSFSRVPAWMLQTCYEHTAAMMTKCQYMWHFPVEFIYEILKWTPITVWNAQFPPIDYWFFPVSLETKCSLSCDLSISDHYLSHAI